MAKQVVIENPILNSPFYEPERHFHFDDEGITNIIVDKRRESGYFVPIAQPRKKPGGAKQLAFDTEWTGDRIEPNKLVSPRLSSKKPFFTFAGPKTPTESEHAGCVAHPGQPPDSWHLGLNALPVGPKQIPSARVTQAVTRSRLGGCPKRQRVNSPCEQRTAEYFV